jgi:uncharacterized protein YkwD
MASRGGKLVRFASFALLAAGAFALPGPLGATAGPSACSQFGNTEAQKLSHAQARRSISCLLNRARHRHGVRHLRTNRRLKRAAERHTDYMKRHRCFSHRCPGEPSFVSRLQRVNYLVGGLRRWKVGENIGWGGGHDGTPKAIVRSWMHSPGHRANILDSQYRQLGIGFVPGCPRSKGRPGGTFTTDFGMRRR